MIAIALGGMLLFEMGEANIYHQTSANHILTMAECLACHSEDSIRPVSVCLHDHCLYTNEHPVQRRYPPSATTREFAPVADILAAGCVLEDGKITCLSCHNLTRPAPHLIRDGDELCYICHRYLRSGS
ncbi:cytochrome c3 family protein [Geomonas oryzisoli]|nr:cytochrome c3 family protein [Geomonas oryzisoli]